MTTVDHPAAGPRAVEVAPPAATTAGLPIPGTPWRVWSQVAVRSAGFPAATALGLADRAVCDAADRVPDVSLNRRPDLAEFEPVWQRYWRGADRTLADIGRAPWFRLAVTWQNRPVLHSGVDPLLKQIAGARGRDSKRRSRETTLVTYLQRYCLKNESIGFFGPLAWAGIDPSLPAVVTVAPGADLLSGVDVHLEGWAVDAVAARFAQRFDLRPWLAPRRTPSLTVVADGVRFPTGRREKADPATVAVLTHADGVTPAVSVAATVARECGIDASAAMALIADLAARRWLRWNLDLAGPLHTDDELATLVDHVGESGVRTALRGDLDRLSTSKARLRSAWDDPERLDGALAQLDETFVELSGVEATRRHGQSYSGRTVAYLESRRDVRVDLGGPFLDALAPVAPLADSARWLTWRVRELFLPHVLAAHRCLARRGTAPDAMALWLECLPLLAATLPDVLATAQEEFHDRWRRILAPDRTSRVLRCSTAELSTAVAAVFDAPRPGWTDGRLCCPDVMVIEDARPGDPVLVLGELHPAVNTLDYQAIAGHHPDPAVLRELLDRDFPRPRLLMALPRDSRPRLTPRSHPALVREIDYRLVVNPGHPVPAAGIAVPAADARVLPRADGLDLVMPDGCRFDVMDLFAEQLKEPMSRSFGLLPGAWRPRIVVDRTVVARESWTVPVRKAAFASLGDERQRFVAARRWAQHLGIPRFVFVKSPLETKPFFVDLDAPPFVEVLSRALRTLARPVDGSASFTVTEMLPEPDQNWLTDAQSQRYTAELRLAMTDSRSVA